MSKKQTYSAQQKVDAVLLVKTIGLTKASEELNILRSTLSYWQTQANKGLIDIGYGHLTVAQTLSVAEELQKARETIKQQEKEIARIAKENKFLQEASSFFAARRVK